MYRLKGDMLDGNTPFSWPLRNIWLGMVNWSFRIASVKSRALLAEQHSHAGSEPGVCLIRKRNLSPDPGLYRTYVHKRL